MSLGIGIGDIIAVSSLACSIWGQVQNSSHQFNAIRDEVAGLHLVLDDVAQNLSERQLSEKQERDLSSLIEGTGRVLEELGLVLEIFQSLGKEQPTIGTKTQKVWKKLRWDQDAIKDFRSRIISNTTYLNAFNSSHISKTSQTILEGLEILGEQVESLQLNKDQHERLALLDWITPLNFPAQQSAVFSRRQVGTGQWLFESSEFKTWMNKPKEISLCKGIPGAGKTTLASIATDHLQRTLRHMDIPVVYIYCDHKKQQEQTPINLVASILKRLLQHRISVPDKVKKTSHYHVNSGTHLNIEEICDMLKDLLAGFSQTYVVVDALDELPVRGQVRQILLASLRSLQKAHSLDCMMTSRSIPQIDHELQGSLFMDIRASDEDNNPKLQEAIANSIVDVVDGMFLLAQLHMDSLTDKTSPKAIRKALERLPMGFGALDIAYDQAMKRIGDQKPGFKDLAQRALSWITYACRLLTVTELRHALAIEVGESEFDEENLDDIKDILSVCCGLVIIDTETGVVRLVHYTTQEYFKKTGSRHFPKAQEDIAVSCLTYFLYGEFGKGWVWDCGGVELKARLESYPPLQYAAQFWARHAEGCTTSFEDRVGKLLFEFLADDYKVSNVGQVLLYHRRNDLSYGLGILSPAPISGLHLATHSNFSDLMSRLLETGLFAADVKDEAGRTPLFWAVHQGHESALKVLLHRQDVDVNTISNDEGSGWSPETALTWAAYDNQVRTVELLLERDNVDINMIYECGIGRAPTTPLHWAVLGRSESVLKILLEHQNILADQPDSRSKTPLFWAAAVGHAGILQLFLERDDVDADHKDDFGTTPLAMATTTGKLEIVKLLLERKDVDVNSKDNNGQTVLELASEQAESHPKPLRAQEILELIRSAVQAHSETI